MGMVLAVVPFLAFGGGKPSSTLPEPLVEVTRTLEGNVIRFQVQNQEAASVTVTFELGLDNLKGSTDFPLTVTLPAHQTAEVFSLSRVREDKEWNFTLTNFFTLGSRLAVHDDTVVYRLPYAAGRSFRVVQGCNGSFSHTGSERYAIDWQMPEGTPVLAARAGVVVAMKDDSQIGGADRKFEKNANYVLIEHADGTIGNYAHLQAEAVRVHTGQTVAAGDVIGFSGNTGFSSGPHLHFSVFKARNGRERESIATRFHTEKGDTTLLEAHSYLAPASTITISKAN